MSTHFSKFPKSNSMEMRLAVLGLFHKNRRMDGSGELSRPCPEYRRCQKRNDTTLNTCMFGVTVTVRRCEEHADLCVYGDADSDEVSVSGDQLVKKFMAFSEPDGSLLHWHLRQWPLLSARWAQFTPFYHIYLRFISMLYFQLHPGLPYVSFLQILDENCIHITHFLHASYMPLPSHTPWSDRPNNTYLGNSTNYEPVEKCCLLRCDAV
jgi:hypothetical protein